MKVLIVDDEPISNFITIRLLNHVSEGLEILEHTKPIEAYAELTSINPDIILLDLNMPDMNGWAFLDKMKREGLKHKVFILTSSVSAVDIDKAARYGNVIECLTKPVGKVKLKECIDWALANIGK